MGTGHRPFAFFVYLAVRRPVSRGHTPVYVAAGVRHDLVLNESECETYFAPFARKEGTAAPGKLNFEDGNRQFRLSVSSFPLLCEVGTNIVI